MALRIILGLSSGLVFVTLANLHFYWALGGRRHAADAVPWREGKPLMQPSRLACAVVGAGLLGCAVTVMAGSLFALWWLRALTAAIAIVFVLRAVGEFRYVGFFKRVKGTRFADLDTRIYSPLCLFLSLAAAGIYFL